MKKTTITITTYKWGRTCKDGSKHVKESVSKEFTANGIIQTSVQCTKNETTIWLYAPNKFDDGHYHHFVQLEHNMTYESYLVVVE